MTRPTTLTLTAAEPAAADAAHRTLTGLVVPYGTPGNTSAGTVVVKAGAVTLPEDLRRVKLVDEHQRPPRAIGYAVAAEDSPAGLRMTFRVGATPAGDAALLEATEGVRDAFSVELADVATDSTGATVTASRLTAVALVTVPAYADAVVDHIAASHNTEGTTMLTDEERARLTVLRARQTLTQDEAAELAALAAREEDPAENTQTPTVAPAPPAGEAAAGAAGVVTPAPAAAVTASMPAGLQGAGGQQAARPTRPIRELFASMARVFSGTSRPELEAALSDITLSANVWTARDEYAGQLWSGLTYQRRFVPLLTPGRLTAPRGTGWRWVTRPEVDDYAGDKTDVPSNQPNTEAVPWTAARLAGAHDLDRALVDFGDSEYLAAYYAAMTESYAMKSDAKARAFILASAAAGVSAGVGTSLFDAVLLAADQLDLNTNGVKPDYVLVNNADRRALLGTRTADVPAFLAAFDIKPEDFIADPAVPAGQVVVGAKAAGTFKELGESPIRVEAVNVTQAGVDGGVYGYWAAYLHHLGGIVRATWA